MFKTLRFTLAASALLASAATTAHAQAVTITMGTTASLGSPISHVNSDNAYEVIYRQGQILQGGNITRLAFEKLSGTNTNPLDHVRIYMKHTTLQLFAADGPIDSTGYQRVFKGSFTNATTSGYQEVVFNSAFAYNNSQNLSILVIRQGGTNTVATDPGRVTWSVGTLSGNGTSRRYTVGAPLTPTSQLVRSQNVANMRLTFGGSTSSIRADEQVIVGGYPNPASTHFTVQLAHPGQAATVRISDVLGQTLRTEAPLATRNGQAQLDVADLPAGLYLLHVTQNQQHAVQRFVKE